MHIPRKVSPPSLNQPHIIKSFYGSWITPYVSSPPVRWGLLDFMSACRPASPPPPPRLRLSSSSTAILWGQCCVPDLNRDPVRSVLRAEINRDPVRSVLRAGPQPRSCEISVACRTSTAILWDQCCVPDLNRDPVRSVLRAGPQPRSCEISVACRTSTAIQICQKICQKICLREVQKECRRKDVRKNVQKCVRKNVRKKWGEPDVVEDIISMMFDSQLSPLQVCAVLL